MANKKSAEKSARQTIVRTARNQSVKSACRNAVKKLRAAIASGDKAAAAAAYSAMSSRYDRAVKAGVIHKNSANRRKSSMSKAVKSIA